MVAAQRDADFAGGVVDAQFVGAAALVFLALDRGQGFEIGQLVRRHVHAVVQAAGDQRLVGIAFEEGDQHFHADARNGDAAGLPPPSCWNAQPATGLVVGWPSRSQKNCTLTRPYSSQ
jgi:hypothetical protein